MEYKKSNNIVGWVIWAIASFVYLSTIEPTVSFWDCGEFVAAAFRLEVGHPPGAPLFMLLGRFFTLFTSGEHAAVAINVLSALSSSFTILFLFWTTTLILKKIVGKISEVKDNVLNTNQTIGILGSAVVGSLAYTFSDSFWFSAVEGEVYALSSLFTAVVFWAILKWEACAEEKNSLRWIVFIAYIMGLSIGVHLLNLLAIPAIVFVYYFKHKEITLVEMIKCMVISVVLLGVIQFGIIPLTYKVGSIFELLFVNNFGMPFHSGFLFYVCLLIALITTGIYITQKNGQVLANTALVSVAMILIGYSTYAIILIRSNANPPMDENNPENVFSLLSYLNREQYGAAPFLTGQYFNSTLDGREPYKTGKKEYIQDKELGEYVQTNVDTKGKTSKTKPNYDRRTTGLLPRMWSNQAHHITAYKQWTNFKGRPVTNTRNEKIRIPTFMENMRFMFRYQFNFMYFRYLMWNFSGRQNDVQSHGEINKGNWLSGIPVIDQMRLGNQKQITTLEEQNPARNKYFMLPFLLGIFGIIYAFRASKPDAIVLLLLFFFTGLAITLYLNQTPIQPRERDYAYVGSFYIFCIWIAVGVFGLQRIFKRIPSIVITAATLILVPGIMAQQNWDDHDRSDTYTARDFARNYLNSCAPNAILFTNGDNDTFPLWYVQEVENYRTDVRVVNLSLLNTDWYVEQMRRKAWESDGIPQRLPAKKVQQGTNDYVPIKVDPRITQHVDVDQIIKHVASESQGSQLNIGGNRKPVDYIPTNKFKVKVDRNTVLKNGTVSPKDASRILPEIKWTYSKGSYMLRNDLIILDILAANDWERPIYFAITTGNDAYIGLTEYFRLEGLAYRLVPYKTNSFDRQTGEVDVDAMYNNLMTKFSWGGIDEKAIYLNENNRRMCMNFRNNFSRLANELIRIGETKKAKEVLDKCIEVFPENNLPYDYYLLSIAEGYYKIKETESANNIMLKLYEQSVEEMAYYNSLKTDNRNALKQDVGRSDYVMKTIENISARAYPESNIEKQLKDIRSIYEVFNQADLNPSTNN